MAINVYKDIIILYINIFIHSNLFAQTTMYNVNRITRNAGQKGLAIQNCHKVKTTLKYSVLH